MRVNRWHAVLGILVVLQVMAFVPMGKADAENGSLAWTDKDGTLGLSWKLRQEHEGSTLFVSVRYPQRLSAAVDREIAASAKRQLDENAAALQESAVLMAEEAREALAQSKDKAALQDTGERSYEVHSNTVYSVFRPSGGYVSVVFRTEEYSGGAHGMIRFKGVSYELQSGRVLELNDLFVKQNTALDWLSRRIAWDVQLQKKGETYSAKKFDPRKVEGDELRSVDFSMKRVALTPEGMQVMYEPYEMGSYADGSFIVILKKDELTAAGVNPALWE